MKKITELKYGNKENELFDIYYPDNDNYDLLIWFHGGGIESGTRKSFDFAEDLTNAGMAIASVEYRMYPNAIFPEFIEDCAKATHYILEHIACNGHVNRVFLSGQSAGAYITMMLALDHAFLENAGADRTKIAGFISDSAQLTTHFNVLRERGLDTRLERIDKAAPLYHLAENSFVGNLLLIYYTDDIPCRPEQNHLFYQSFKKLCPGQHIEMVELPGCHCNGSVNRNEHGHFDYVDVLLNFIERI